MLTERETIEAGMRALWALVERAGGEVAIAAAECPEGAGLIRVARYGDGSLRVVTGERLDG